MVPSGTQYPIEADGYTATITEIGATLRQLQRKDRDLVAGFAADSLRPVYRGAVLAPWPNRIADGRYEFGGNRYQLPVNEAGRNNALHGLVSWAPWTATQHDASSVTLHTPIHPCDGYPFRLDLTVSYALSDAGLTTTVEAVNAGDAAAPYGCAPHPYLVAGSGRVDDWMLELTAARYLEVTPDRLLPVRTVDVGGTPFDFATARHIATTRLDHPFTGLGADAAGLAHARLTAADGHGVEMRWEAAALPWLQVHTADRPEPELNRAGLAVEPMTCPPDAFNSGTDLVILQPGQRHRASWTIAAI